ncbi:MAG: flagellin [Alphaproteobacteria bacterium]|nr:flagellin [Alphaproteobacteria bacterium]
MSQTISTNVNALSARRLLDLNASALGLAQDRLSSGKVVSDPSQNPSAAAIGSVLDSAINSMAQASNNATQASAVIQLATGALGSSIDVLTRMSTLSAQANSDTISDPERAMLNNEFTQLMAQIDQNAQANWAGVELFTGGAGAAVASGAIGTHSTIGLSTNPTTLFGTDGTGALSFSETVGSLSGAVTVNASAIGVVSVTIGTEIFSVDLTTIAGGYATAAASGQTLKLTSQADTSKSISFKIGNAVISGAVSATAAATAATTSLTNILTAGPGGIVNFGTQASGLKTQANAFSGGLNLLNTQGMYTGSATNATVTANGNLYDVNVTIGAQTFKATTAPTIGGALTLFSTTDAGNSISFNYDRGSVAGLNNAANFQTSLKSLLGIGTGANAVLTSSSVAAPLNTVLTAGAGTAAGSYGLSYTVSGTTGTFKLTDGADSWTSTIQVNGTLNAGNATSVSFSNGVSLALNSGFVTTASTDMSTYNVANGNSLVFQFQIGQQSSDTIALTFNGATTSALGMLGLSITTKANAAAATTTIQNATSTINTQIAQLGGTKSRLDYVVKNLNVSIQNQSAAKSTFTDADITEELMNSQKFQALVDMSSAVFQQTLKKQSQLAQMVQSALR